MNLNNAHICEELVWTMRLADWPRSQNRALINALFNGLSPYTAEEQVQNRITTNVNFLEAPKIAHDACRQYVSAFLVPDPIFNIDIDYGPVWKRREWSEIVTKEIAKVLRKSLNWFELRRSNFASNVLHGIAPSVWSDPYSWCPDVIGVDDALVPSDTLLTMKNLPVFAVYRRYTAMQLWKMTHTGTPDPGWNIPLADRAIAWADEQSRVLMGASWPEFWSPEKMQERIKSDGAFYTSDAVPTIDCYDVYFWNDDGKKAGWNRRIVLDAWGDPGIGIGGAGAYVAPENNKTRKPGLDDLYKDANGNKKTDFLYNSGNRVYARSLSNIIHWQFGDASVVAPFRYHSVRSLGYLLYAVCHLQNRLRCKFNDAVFESMLQYFRVSNPADAERLTQVDLIDKGVIPEGLNFVQPGERWRIQLDEFQIASQMNRQSMADNSASFTQDFDFGLETRRNETATRTNAKQNATAALVGAMLSQAYKYEEFRYMEMSRRFCIKNSKDPEVRQFRLNCLQQEVPEEALNYNLWNVKPVKIIGSGNRDLQISIAEAMMRVRPLLDPSAQKLVDRMYISAYTEDYAITSDLVPEIKAPSPSVEKGSYASSALLQGLLVPVPEGINRTEYIESLLANLAAKIQSIEQSGGMATQEEINGFTNMAKHISQNIAILAQDKSEKARVKQYGDDLAKLMNLVKAYAQRLQEQQQQSAQAQGGMDPKTQAQVQAIIIKAQTDAEVRKQSNAQRTAQRQLQFEQKVRQDAIKTAQDVHQSRVQHAHDLAARELEAASNIRQSSMASMSE